MGLFLRVVATGTDGREVHAQAKSVEHGQRGAPRLVGADRQRQPGKAFERLGGARHQAGLVGGVSRVVVKEALEQGVDARMILRQARRPGHQ
jgi:hypothetical protein